LKRSNRLILLVGVFLAAVAFVAIFVLLGNSNSGGGSQPPPIPTTATVVKAVKDIPLGVVVTAEMVQNQTVELGAKLPTGLTDTSQIVGRKARKSIGTGAQLTVEDLTGSAGAVGDIDCPEHQRCIAVQVDQVSGVGTVIKPGDYVDLLAGFDTEVVQVQKATATSPSNIQVVTGLNQTSVKLLVQGMQVVGTLLPPPAAAAQQAPPSQPAQGQTTSTGGSQQTALNGQQEIVILSVSPQQAEVIKFAQMEGNVTLVLRAASEFTDPTTHQIIQPTPDETTGMILRILVRDYGVLVPELVEAIVPSQTSR